MPTQDFIDEVYQQDTPEVFLQILKIDHEDLDEPIRVVNNSTDIIIDIDVEGIDETYVAFPFKINLPTNIPGEISQTSLEIDNISRQVSLAIRSISSAPTVTMWVVFVKTNVLVEPSFVTADLSFITVDVSFAEPTPFEEGKYPYSVEAGPYIFSFRNITYTAFKVQGALSYEDILNQPYPKQKFTPNKFPAAF